MTLVPGFSISETLHSGPRSLVFRAHRLADDLPVVVKVPQRLGDRDRARILHELETAWRLDSPHVYHPVELLDSGDLMALVTEDIGAVSLASIQHASPLSVVDAVQMLARISKALCDIHSAHVVHKDICPSNIVFNSSDSRINVVDFASSTSLATEDMAPRAAQIALGKLFYVSPEQTGRMNRSVDFRTDFYSLGVVAYELLTQRLPFDSKDPMEILHGHLAKTPAPPCELRSEVPRCLSDVVMRLLRKNAEQRYQSAEGIVHDLTCCLELMSSGQAQRTFSLGQGDVPLQFTLSERLHGRDAEIETVWQAFGRALAGRPHVLWVSGQAGIGKTSVINEVYKPATKRRGFFVSGKYDQLQRTGPYSALLSALRALVRQLLCETEHRLAHWRKAILDALGSGAQVIVDVIPELEHVIGTQPPLPELGALETRNRFHRLFRAFLAVLCSEQHPVVMFLDDLQWGDAASFGLLEEVLSSGEVKHFLLIGAFRDSELGAGHPLKVLMSDIEKGPAQASRIELTPLAVDDVNGLCAESLLADRPSTLPLAQLVVEKTGGNPFFVRQFLSDLHSRSFITYDPSRRRWTWERTATEQAQVTDNVADLLDRRIGSLPDVTQKALQVASCLGAEVELDLLAGVMGCATGEAFERLAPAVEERLLVPTSELVLAQMDSNEPKLVYPSFRFLHDRVQTAANASIHTEKKHHTIHLKIARILLDQLTEEQRSKQLFDIVDHLNAATSLIVADSELLSLARLNLEAGTRALKATAYEAAAAYFWKGIGALDSWGVEPPLAFELHLRCAEVEYLQGHADRSNELVTELLARVSDPTDKAKVYKQRIWQYTVQARHDQVLDTGRNALAILGIPVPQRDFGPAIAEELERFSSLLGDRDIAALVDLPEMEDQRVRIAMQILAGMQPSAFMTNQDYYALIDIKLVNLSLEYGNCPESASGYGTFGIILWAMSADYRRAYEFGRLAWDLSERFGNDAQKCKDGVHFASFLLGWIDPLRDSVRYFDDAYKAGVDTGELQWAGYNLQFKSINLHFLGWDLVQLAVATDEQLAFAEATHNEVCVSMAKAVRLPVWRLLGRTDWDGDFSDDHTDEESFTELYGSQKTQMAIFYSFAAEACFIQGRNDQALQYASQAEELTVFMPGVLANATLNYVSSLALLRQCEDCPQSQASQSLLEKVLENQQKMALWAESAPHNFAHLHILVEAERARLRGDRLLAIDGYEEAVGRASEMGFRQHEAVACELAARFWQADGKETIAQAYLRRAIVAYGKWGATGKVDALGAGGKPSADVAISTSSPDIDLHSIMKAAHAISREVVVDRLVRRVLQITIENAGADRGLLLLGGPGDLRVQAEGDQKGTKVEVRDDHNDNNEQRLCWSVARYVARTGSHVLLDDATHSSHADDPYVQDNNVQSILCVPVVNRGDLLGVLYLENTVAKGAFPRARVSAVELLAAQCAISIENAQLYAGLEQKVARRTEELRQAYEDLKGAQQKLIEQAREAGQSDVARMTLHDVGNLLSSVHTCGELLSESLEKSYVSRTIKKADSLLRAHMSIIEEHLADEPKLATLVRFYLKLGEHTMSERRAMITLVERLNRVSGSMRSALEAQQKYAEKQTPPERCDIAELIQGIVDLRSAEMKAAGIDISFDSSANDLTAYVQKNKIVHVINNIVDNARDAMSEKGDEANAISVKAHHGDGLVVLRISDNGQGIAPEDLTRIFHYGVTSKPGGPGVGLHVSANLMTEMGGTISAQSAGKGLGACFEIAVPSAVSSAPR